MYIIEKKVPFLGYPLYVGNPALTSSRYSHHLANAKQFKSKYGAFAYRLFNRLNGKIVPLKN